MGIRDLINEKFGWSRKTASLTLLVRGVLSIPFLLTGLMLVKDGLNDGELVVINIMHNRYSLHEKDHRYINTAILFSTRVEELLNWAFMHLLQLFIFFPPGFALFVIFLTGVTAYFIITRFSEDSNRAAEHANVTV